MSEATHTEPGQNGSPGAKELIRARIWLILALGAIGAVAGFAGSELSSSTEYEAEAVMFHQESPVSASLTNNQWVQAPATNPQRERSATVDNLDPTANAAAQVLGTSPDEVLDVVHIEPDLEQERIYVYGVDADADRAATYANTFAEQFERKAEAFDQIEIKVALARSEQTLAELTPELLAKRPGKDVRDQIARLEALQITGTDRIHVIREAKVPTEPAASGLPLRATLAGGLAGILLGLAIACWPLVRRGDTATS
jgi:capsular polysaccharide biosynthesis protein